MGESKIVDIYDCALRRKVDEGRPVCLIETIRGAGYRLGRQPTRVSDERSSSQSQLVAAHLPASFFDAVHDMPTGNGVVSISVTFSDVPASTTRAILARCVGSS